MAKRKAGLHKNVSSIFDGVSVPNAKKDELTKSSTQGGTEDKSKAGKAAELTSAPPNVPAESKPKPISKPTPLEKPIPVNEPALVKKSAPSEKFAQTNPKVTPVKRTKTAKRARNRYPKKNIWSIGSKIFLQKKIEAFRKLTPTQLKKQKVMLILMPVLLIVLAVVVLPKFKSNPAATNNQTVVNQANPSHDGIEIKANSDADLEIRINWTIPDKYPEGLRDPMSAIWIRKIVRGDSIMYDTPSTEDETEVAEGEETDGETIYVDEIIVISSILFGTEGSSVVIDNEILYEGDSVYGAVIKKIDKNIVLFEKDGVIFQKSLPR